MKTPSRALAWMNAAQVRTFAMAETLTGADGGCGYEVSIAFYDLDVPARQFGFKKSDQPSPRLRLGRRVGGSVRGWRMARQKNAKRQAPEVCPVCGEEVPRNALACPECGADHNSGWREDADTYDGIDLPE